jgi:hypothetical protein
VDGATQATGDDRVIASAVCRMTQKSEEQSLISAIANSIEPLRGGNQLCGPRIDGLFRPSLAITANKQRHFAVVPRMKRSTIREGHPGFRRCAAASGLRCCRRFRSSILSQSSLVPNYSIYA